MSRKPSYVIVLGLVLVVMGFFEENLRTQVTTATISGVLHDETGAVLPGAQVTVRNVGTGQTRAVISDARGRYRAPQLPVGSYEIRAELSGFQTSVRSGITLTVGQEAVIDLVLTVGGITQQVVVTGEAPLVETTGTAVGGLVDVDMISELPLNGRSFQELVALQTGVTTHKNPGSRLNQGRGERISVSGARSNANTYAIDGLSIEDQMGQTPVSTSGNMLGVEGVREFGVLTNSFSAQYGGASGAVVNILTRSGANEFHGSLYEFLRNSALDAKNFFDKLDKPIPPFKRNQFGGSGGGPIVKDRTFFFVNYESLRERLGVTQVANVPDENAHKGLIPKGGVLTDVGVKEAVKPYLALYPLPNARNFGNGIAEYLSSFSQPTDEHYGMVRIDHRFSDSDSMFGRYLIDDAVVAFPEALNRFSRPEVSRQQSAVVEEVRLITPNLINSFRFGYGRNFGGAFVIPLFSNAKELAFPYRFQDFGTGGQLTVGGLFPMGIQNLPKNLVFNHFQWNDTLSYTRGAHFLNFGFDAKRFRFNFNSCIDCSGAYAFSTLETFLTSTPRTFTALLPGADTVRHLRWNNFGLFFQDEWRVSSRLNLNLGLRYDAMTVPTDTEGKNSNWANPFDRQVTLGPMFKNPTLKNFQPRIGLAWDVFGNGKTSLRSAFGVFSPPFNHSIWQIATVRQPPFTITGTLVNPIFPNPQVVAGAPGTFRINLSIDPNVDNPTMIQYNFAIQQEVLPNTAVKVTYVGSHGYHLDQANNTNMAYPQIQTDGRKFFPPGSQVRNSAVGEHIFVTTDANSFYNSLQIELIQRLTRGFRVQGNYTFAKSVDDASTNWHSFIGETKGQDADNRRESRGLSSFDNRHSAAISSTYELPFGSGKAWGNSLSGVADRVVSGWSLLGITTLHTGRPLSIVNGNFAYLRAYTPDTAGRPDLKPGASNNPVLGGPDRYYDVNAFKLQDPGYFGNVGRNTVIGPGLVNFNISLVKKTRIREGQALEFRAEFFNLFNHPNLGEPNGIVFLDASGNPSRQAGRIDRTLTTSRQVQFALRYSF